MSNQENEASWQAVISGPKSLGLFEAISNYAINAGVSLDQISESKGWITSTVVFKVSGTLTKVQIFKTVLEEVFEELGASFD
jgi:hypothetical protein